MLEASPVHDATLAAAPAEVRLRFNSRIEHGLTRLSLEEDGGRPVPLPAGTPAAPGPDRLIVRLPPLPPGRYVLRFTVLAADGHLTSSALRFSVRAAATR